MVQADARASLVIEATVQDAVTRELRRVGLGIGTFSQRANRSLGLVTRSVRGMNLAFRATRRVVRLLTPGIGGLVAGFAGLAAIGSATRSAGDFREAMAEVSTLVGDASVNMADLRAESLGLARDLGLNEIETAKGLYQTLSSDISLAAGAMDFLGEASKFAIAGVTDQASAVDLLVTGIRLFDREVSDSTELADQFFATIAKGRINITQLASVFGRAAPLAAKVGVEIEELNAAFATITGGGGGGPAEAATQLRGLFSALLRNAEQIDEAFKSVGERFKENTIETIGLAGTLEILVRATKGSSRGLQALLQDTEALAGALNLTGAASETFRTNLEAVRNSAGASGEAFDKIFGSQVFQARRTFNALRITVQGLGDAVIDEVARIVEAAGGLDEFLKPFEVGIEGLAALIASVIGSMGDFIQQLNTVIEGLGGADKAAALLGRGFSLAGEAAALAAQAVVVGVIQMADALLQFSRIVANADFGTAFAVVFGKGIAAVRESLQVELLGIEGDLRASRDKLEALGSELERTGDLDLFPGLEVAAGRVEFLEAEIARVNAELEKLPRSSQEWNRSLDISEALLTGLREQLAGLVTEAKGFSRAFDAAMQPVEIPVELVPQEFDTVAFRPGALFEEIAAAAGRQVLIAMQVSGQAAGAVFGNALLFGVKRELAAASEAVEVDGTAFGRRVGAAMQEGADQFVGFLIDLNLISADLRRASDAFLVSQTDLASRFRDGLREGIELELRRAAVSGATREELVALADQLRATGLAGREAFGEGARIGFEEFARFAANDFANGVDLASGAMEGLRSSASDALFALGTGADSAGDAMRRFAIAFGESIVRILADLAALKLAGGIAQALGLSVAGVVIGGTISPGGPNRGLDLPIAGGGGVLTGGGLGFVRLPTGALPSTTAGPSGPPSFASFGGGGILSSSASGARGGAAGLPSTLAPLAGIPHYGHGVILPPRSPRLAVVGDAPVEEAVIPLRNGAVEARILRPPGDSAASIASLTAAAVAAQGPRGGPTIHAPITITIPITIGGGAGRRGRLGDDEDGEFRELLHRITAAIQDGTSHGLRAAIAAVPKG